MTSTFKTLETKILDFITKKIKLGSLTVGNVQEICTFQQGYLAATISSLSAFAPRDLDMLRQRYFNKPRRNDKPDPRMILLELKSDLRNKAGLYERAMPFGAALKAANTFLKIVTEIKKNAPNIVGSGTLTVDGAKITDVVMLGILRECDLFNKYTSYLWEYFRVVLDDAKGIPPYRAKYLLDNQEAYMDILQNVCEQSSSYTFLNEIETIKRKNADFLLYANKSSFLPFINRSNYTLSHELHIKNGIIGFNIFAWIVGKWEDWKYAQYKKTQKHRDWLQQEEIRLKQILMDQDPNSPAAKETAKYLEIYSAEVAKLDQEINKFEEGN